ncbi:MAG: hypothetical protein AAFX93_02640 [Verrucomicrobiota bacterium]
MPSDHLPRAPKRHIPKWPFWIGDALLVIAGVYLAFTQEGALTTAAMAWVVVSVALGALIACAPYVIELIADAINGGPGGDWAEIRNKVVKLEFRLAEIELNNGSVPESARIAHSRFTESDEDLGVGEVIKQPKAAEAATPPANPHFNFGPTGASLVGSGGNGPDTKQSPDDQLFADDLPLESEELDPELGVGPVKVQQSDPDDEMDLPTSLEEIGPAENGNTNHLRKALDHARKNTANRGVHRLIAQGKRSASG